MAKVIHTILNLKDNLSKGLLTAAKNTKSVTQEMKDATREVIKFGNKSEKAVKGFASTAAKAFAGTATALAGSFVAMASLTEEYRAEQGKLNAAFETAGYSAEVASEAYKDFFKITGDTGTAVEASQLLAELTQNTQDIATWVDIAAGAYSKWGTAMDTAGLIESINETQKAGTVTGSLADMLVWGFDAAETFGVALKANTEANEEWNEAVKAAETTEDFFNLALQECGNEAERNKLIMDTLSGAYGDAAKAFYENNDALMQTRERQALVADVTAKLGDASANAQNQVWKLFGAQEDGSIRAGSALEFVLTKTDEFTDWVNNLDFSKLEAEFDKKFAGAVETATDAFAWLNENSDTVISTLKTLGGVFLASKVMKFTADTVSSVQTLGLFGKTVLEVGKSKIPTLAKSIKNTGTAVADNVLLNGFWVKNQAKKVGGALGNFGKSAASAGKTFATGLGANAKNAGTSVKQFGKTAASTGKTFATGLGANAKNAGTSMKQFGKSAVAAGKTAATGLGPKIVGVAGKLASFGQLAFGFVAANPIVLFIGAAIAAGVLLWQNWDTVKSFAVELWDKITEVFGGIGNSISGTFDSARDKVSGFFSWLDAKIESVPILGDIYSGGKSAVGWIAGQIAGNAMGTNYWTGGLTMVHERGGELINLPSGTQIIPHDISLRAAQSYGQALASADTPVPAVSTSPTYHFHFTVQGNMIGNEQAANQFGEIIIGKVLSALNNM